MKKIITGLIVLSLTVMFAAGAMERDDIFRAIPGFIADASTGTEKDEVGHTADKPEAGSAKETEVPRGYPAEEQPEATGDRTAANRETSQQNTAASDPQQGPAVKTQASQETAGKEQSTSGKTKGTSGTASGKTRTAQDTSQTAGSERLARNETKTSSGSSMSSPELVKTESDDPKTETERPSGAETAKNQEPASAPDSNPAPEAGTQDRQDQGSGAETLASPESAKHVHDWESVTVFHEEISHTVHHDAVTEQRWVSVPERINHFYCDKCRMEFATQEEIYAHEDASYEAAMETGDFSLIHSGHYMITETVDHGYYETVTVAEAYDETVIDQPAWEEHGLVCRICGLTK